jgi:hypothetical protein
VDGFSRRRFLSSRLDENDRHALQELPAIRAAGRERTRFGGRRRTVEGEQIRIIEAPTGYS